MPVFFYFYNMKEESAYKCHIDKNEFKALSFVEADNHYGYWKNKSMKERLDTACYIIQRYMVLQIPLPLIQLFFLNENTVSACLQAL